MHFNSFACAVRYWLSWKILLQILKSGNCYFLLCELGSRQVLVTAGMWRCRDYVARHWLIENVPLRALSLVQIDGWGASHRMLSNRAFSHAFHTALSPLV